MDNTFSQIEQHESNLRKFVNIATRWNIDLVSRDLNRFPIIRDCVINSKSLLNVFTIALKIEVDKPENGKAFEIDIKDRFFPMIEEYFKWYEQNKEKTKKIELDFYKTMYEDMRFTMNEINKYSGITETELKKTAETFLKTDISQVNMTLGKDIVNDSLNNNETYLDDEYADVYYKDYNTKEETTNITNRTKELLAVSDSLDKLLGLNDIKKELFGFSKLAPLRDEVTAEIDRLETKHRIGQLPAKCLNDKSKIIFKTKLSEEERKALCDKIITDNGGKVDKGVDNRLFVEAKEKHRQILMYLLGGNYPDKVETMKVAVIANLHTLLKDITNVDGTGKNKGIKVVPGFMKRFCIEHLRNSMGGKIGAIK